MTRTRTTSWLPEAQNVLTKLRRRLRARLFAEGIAQLVLALSAILAVTLGLDALFRFERPVRAVLGCAGLAGLLGVLWRRIVRPLFVPMTPRSLAVLVERAMPALSDRLLTAMELAGREETDCSATLLAKTAAQAEEMLRSFSFRQVVEMRRLRNRTVSAVLCLAVVCGFFAVWPNVLRLWLQRIVLLAEADWPQRTYLSVFYTDPLGRIRPLRETDASGTIRHWQETAQAIRGETLDILVAAHGEAPEDITLRVWYPSAGETEETLSPLPPEEAARYSAGSAAKPAAWYRRRFVAVQETFRFSAVGGDDFRDARRPHRVELVEAPALEDVRFVAIPPAYQRQPGPTVFSGGRGVLTLLHGSTLRIDARANKPLASAWLRLDDEKPVPMTLNDPDAAAPPCRATGELLLRGTNVSAAHRLSFLLQDTSGYTSRRGEMFLLQILPDQSPILQLRSRGVGNIVCPTARIPLEVRATDDYGLAEVGVEWRSEGAAADTQPSASSAWKPVAAPPDSPSGVSRKRTVRCVLDLASEAISPGAKVRVRAGATDTLPAELGGPNCARSEEQVFEVVSREEILSRLVSRQKEARLELFQAMGQQEFARGRCEAVAQAPAEAISPDDARKLADAAARQRYVRQEAEKVAASMAETATELELNRLSLPEELAVLREGVAIPLRKLSATFRKILAETDVAQREKDPSALRRRAAAIAAKQRRALRAMEAVLANMRSLEDRLEMARRLESLLKLSVELDTMLRQRIEKGVEDLFEEAEEGKP